MFKKILLPVFYTVLIAQLSFAQVNLYSSQNIVGPSEIEAMGKTADGGYIIAGLFDRINGTRCKNVSKIDALGNLSGTFHQFNTDSEVHKILGLPDGKILIAGSFHSLDQTQGSLVRLNADGTIDDTFQKLILNPAESVFDFVIQSSGRIIVVGNFSVGNSAGVLRLNSDGTIDDTFKSGIASDLYTKVIIDNADSIYTTNGKNLFKLSVNGEAVSGFPISTDGQINQIKMYGGKVLIAGYFSSVKNSQCNAVAVIEPNGMLNTFRMKISNPSPVDMAVKADGRIVIVASYQEVNLFNGQDQEKTLIYAFSNNVNRPRKLLMDENEAFLVSSKTGLTVGAKTKGSSIVRFNKDCIFDATFKCEVTYTSGLSVLGTYPDGKFVAFTDATTPIVKSWTKRLVRFNPNGTIDNTFKPVVDGVKWIQSLAIQSTGKILYCSENVLYRLLKTGAKDASFTPITPPLSYNVFTKIKIKDGKIYLAGMFSSINGYASSGIVRLLADGAVDATFTSTLPEYAYVSDFQFQSDGKIVVSGGLQFQDFETRIARLNTDGSIDESFTRKGFTGAAANYLAIDGQNRIYTLGNIIETIIPPHQYFGRLLPNGELDETFKPVLPFHRMSSASSVEVIGDNLIFVGAENLLDFGPNYNGYVNRSFVLYDAYGNEVNSALSSYGQTGTIHSTFRDGSKLYLSGHIDSPDGSDAAIATLNATMTDQAIQFDAIPEKVYGDSPFALNASSSSGLPVVLVSQDTDVATITGNTVTIHKAGQVSIKAFQGGNENFFPAVPIERTLVVKKSDQTITFDEIPDKVFGDAPFVLNASASSGLPVVFVSQNPDIATITDNTVTILKAGQVSIKALQDGNENFSPAEPIERTLTLHKADQIITFDEIPEKEIESLSESNTFTISCTTSSGLAAIVVSADESIASVDGLSVTMFKAGEVLLTATQAGNENYNAAQSASQLLTITQVVVPPITGTELLPESAGHVYPSPGKGLYTIFVLPSLATGNYSVISSTGVLKQTQAYSAYKGRLQIDITNYPAGLYLIKIGNSKESSIYKVIKE
jgi:uncharacterized delta-60 repeat protein